MSGETVDTIKKRYHTRGTQRRHSRVGAVIQIEKSAKLFTNLATATQHFYFAVYCLPSLPVA